MSAEAGRRSFRVHDHAVKIDHNQLSPRGLRLEKSKSWKDKRFGRPAAIRKRRFTIGVLAVLFLAATVCAFSSAAFRSFHRDGDPSSERGLASGEKESDDTLQSGGLRSFNNDKNKTKSRRKGPCPIAFRNTTIGLEEPADSSSRFESFPLNYVHREKAPDGDLDWQPKFGGHQSLAEREESFLARNQTLHCGFVEGPEGSPSTGFDLSEGDKEYLQTCHIAVSSCIFGNHDHLHVHKVSSTSLEKVCFAIFVDQQSLDTLIEEGRVAQDGNLTSGVWRIVLVKNLPYEDHRRTGKVPKFLTHRLFPNAKYSIWVDGKLRLQSDPLLILEHFLWTGGHEYGISNHYDRHCVWDEVNQNKKLNKFDHGLIDAQFEFYKEDGLYKFNASDTKKLLTSHVPEGSFIVRAHTPMSNLFSCLWYNEVERFTSRDQLSFAYTYLKLVRKNPGKKFRFHMFKDCERRAMTRLFQHTQKDEKDPN